VWVPPDVRDLVVDFVRCWSEKTEIGAGRFIHWLGVRASKFYDWRERYGRVNEHNGWVPRDFWLQPWEKQAIIGFHREHPLEGYRRLTFMMLDADVVAVSPSSVWRVLQQAGLLSRWKGKPSRKGSGFEQPPHARSNRMTVGFFITRKRNTRALQNRASGRCQSAEERKSKLWINPQVVYSSVGHLLRTGFTF
jgi:hypothetical protein